MGEDIQWLKDEKYLLRRDHERRRDRGMDGRNSCNRLARGRQWTGGKAARKRKSKGNREAALRGVWVSQSHGHRHRKTVLRSREEWSEGATETLQGCCTRELVRDAHLQVGGMSNGSNSSNT